MTNRSMPLSLTHGAAVARTHELWVEARRHEQVRALRPGPAGRPLALLAALRAGTSELLPHGLRRAPAVCQTC